MFPICFFFFFIPSPSVPTHALQGNPYASSTRPTISDDKGRAAYKLENLRRLLAWDDEAMLAQRPNIRWLISHYEGGGNGPPPDGSWWLRGGVIVDRQPPLDEWGAGVWEELVCHPALSVFL